MTEWHLVTGEYPPDVGGVGDYTRQIALGLIEAGETVHVWCPGDQGAAAIEQGIAVHRAMGDIGRTGLARLDEQLDTFRRPRRLLLQWVPHAFGFRSLNVGFCVWVWKRSHRDGDHVEIMVHEPSLEFRAASIRQSIAALVHRLMTVLLLGAARRVWFSIPEWERRWRPYRLGRPVEFRGLPVPSNIPVIDDPAGIAVVRARYAARGGALIGHFGLQSAHHAALWTTITEAILGDHPEDTFLLIGAGSTALRDAIAAAAPSLAGRIHATGKIEADALSRHLSACDVLVQPYPDGVNARRGTVMAALAHGRPIVTTVGRHSETFWRESGAVIVSEPFPAAIASAARSLLGDPPRRDALARNSRAFYEGHFDVRRAVAALRREPEREGS